MKEKVKEKVGLGSTAEPGKGKSKMSRNIKHVYHLVKWKSHHPMEDYVVADFKHVADSELGFLAIFDGHLSHKIPDYLKSHLFDNFLNEAKGSTAVTAISINGQKLVIANVADSRAVLCKNGEAKQLSVYHEPTSEKESIENRGGFKSKFPGDVARVDGQLAVARAFGYKILKEHLSSEPDVIVEIIEDDTELLILASDGLWKVMTNQEAVDAIRNIKVAWSAEKHLTEEVVRRNSTDDNSCIVERF